MRGRRPQAAFCRRLGYKSNVAYTGEAGRGFPTAAQALAVARQMGGALEACSSLRLVDLIETLVDPQQMPSIRERWQSMVVARRLA